jgi:hypothetical protein
MRRFKDNDIFPNLRDSGAAAALSELAGAV